MQTTLSDRLRAWFELFQKLEDLEFQHTPVFRPAEEIFDGYPEDARELARTAGELLLVYRSTDPAKETNGTLCLTLLRGRGPLL